MTLGLAGLRRRFRGLKSLRALYHCVRERPLPTFEGWQRVEAGRFNASGGDAAWRFRDDLGPGDVVVDLGAGRGDFSAEMRRRRGCRVLAFEAAPEFFSEAQDRFGGDPGVEVHPYSLGGRTAMPGTGAGSRPFSEVMERLGIARVGLLKIDIDGGEYELLEALASQGWLSRIERLQIRWYASGDRARARRRKLESALSASHRLQWRFDWIWETWTLQERSPDPDGEAVEVVIPAYNAEKFIAKAIASVLAQTLRPAGLIVVDDGSFDGTAAAVDALARASGDTSIRLIRQENRGPNAARNAGLAASRAPFVAFLDADDFWDPAKLGLQMEVMRRSPGVGLVFCGQNDVDAEERPSAVTFRFDGGMRGDCSRRLLWGNAVTGSASAVVLRRSALRRSGWFEESLRCGEDWEAWGRMARSMDLDYAAAKLVTIRRHPASNMAAHLGAELAAELRVIGILAEAHGPWGRLQARLSALRRLCMVPLPQAWNLASEAPPALFEGPRWALWFPALVFMRLRRGAWRKLFARRQATMPS